ncbi:MAG: BPSS1780 family membrane protein [Burkholderiales bacterium]
METRIVAADRGWQWIVEGFRMFRGQPLAWIAMVVIMLVISIASAMIPLLGALILNLVTPVFFAGLMIACRTADQGGEPQVGQLFSAFKTHAAPLVTVGGIYLVGNIIAVGAMFAVAGGAALPALLGKGAANPEALRTAMGGLMLGFAIGLAVFAPVLMAVWFAPLLIVFRNIAPIEAMKLSLLACWQNMMPFLVYGVIALVLSIAAFLPLMLGFIVLIPVLVCSIYISYKDVFPETEAEEPPQQDNPLLS